MVDKSFTIEDLILGSTKGAKITNAFNSEGTMVFKQENAPDLWLEIKPDGTFLVNNQEIEPTKSNMKLFLHYWVRGLDKVKNLERFKTPTERVKKASQASIVKPQKQSVR